MGPSCFPGHLVLRGHGIQRRDVVDTALVILSFSGVCCPLLLVSGPPVSSRPGYAGLERCQPLSRVDPMVLVRISSSSACMMSTPASGLTGRIMLPNKRGLPAPTCGTVGSERMRARTHGSTRSSCQDKLGLSQDQNYDQLLFRED